MRPIYPNIAVEPISDNESVLVQTVEHRPVVKVIGIPSCPEDEVLYFTEGNSILVNHVDEYMVKGKKMFFVNVRDVVCVI